MKTRQGLHQRNEYIEMLLFAVDNHEDSTEHLCVSASAVGVRGAEEGELPSCKHVADRIKRWATAMSQYLP